MFPLLQRTARSSAFPYVLLALLVLVHRLVLFATLQPHFDALIALRPELLTWQFLPVPLLRDHLATALLYLQQNPPLPQLMLGVALKVAAFPQQSAYLLVALQALIATATALLLYGLLLRVPIGRVPAWLLAATFALSADLILLEYNSFGQTFYENLCMPLLLGVIWWFRRAAANRQRRDFVVLGLFVATLALSRASFGYFFLPLAAALLLTGAGMRATLLFLVPVLVLQGGWTLKNLALYDYVSLPATSWTGTNLAIGVARRDAAQADALRRSILAHPHDHPAWYERMTAEQGLLFWHGPYARYVPASIAERDRAIAAALPGNPATNSLAAAAVAAENGRAVRRYALENPVQFARGVWQSYRLFWHPIREYARMFVALVLPVQSIESVWREGGAGAVLRRYERENYRVLHYRPLGPLDTTDPCTVGGCVPGGPLALPYAPLLVYLFAIVAVHALGPPLLVLSRRRDSGIDRRLLIFLYLVFAYVACVASVGEHGENHRFRLAVEPAIWTLAAAIAAGWWRLLRGLRS